MTIAREFTATGAADPSTPWDMSWSHTSAGGEHTPILIGFALNAPSTGSLVRNVMTPTVTVGGQPAMLLAARNLGVNDNFGAAFVYIIWDRPGTTTVQVSVAHSAGTATILHGTSVSYTGVRGVHQVVENAVSSTSNPSHTVLSEAERYLFHVGSMAGTTFSGYTQNLLYNDATDSQRVIVGDAPGASSVNFGWTTGSVSSVSIVVELIAADDPTGLVLIRSMSLGTRVTGNSTSLSASLQHLLDFSDLHTLAVVGMTASIETSGDPTCTVTWGGVPMTQWAFYTSGTSITRNAVGLYTLQNPPTGDSTISVQTGGDSTKRAVIAASAVYNDVDAIFSVASPNAALTRSSTDPAGWRAVAVFANGNELVSGPGHELYRGGAATSGAGDYGSIIEAATEGDVSITLGHPDSSTSIPAGIIGRIRPRAYADVGPRSGFMMFFGAA